MCFNVVQNERGLVGALLARQRRDHLPDDRPRPHGLSRGGLEPVLDRLELCNYGDAKQRPSYYDHVSVADQKREKEVVKINR